jgi:hypothetical protein
MPWVPGVSIGEEGAVFWPWHRNREDYFTTTHYRIGASPVLACKDCGGVLASPIRTKQRRDAGIKHHNDLHRQICDLQEQVADLQEQMAYLYEHLGLDTGDDDDATDTQSPQSGYLESSYDVRQIGSGTDSDDDGGQ